jgi:hypothetical protein
MLPINGQSSPTCSECLRLKARCDGQRPCGYCVQRGLPPHHCQDPRPTAAESATPSPSSAASMASVHRTCIECARLKTRCDGHRPCGYCLHRGVPPHLCVDRESRSSEGAAASMPVRVYKSCEMCKIKKIKCTGEMPCRGCVQRGAQHECYFKSSNESQSSPKSTMASEASQSSTGLYQSVKFQPQTLDYAHNTMLLLRAVQSISPLSIAESLSVISRTVAMNIFFRWSCLLLSPYGANIFFQQVHCLLQTVPVKHGFQPTVDKVQEMAAAAKAVQSVTVSSAVDPTLEDLLVQQKDEYFTSSHAVLVINSSLQSPTFELVFNSGGQQLFMLSNPELQMMTTSKDISNQKITKKSGFILPPSFLT